MRLYLVVCFSSHTQKRERKGEGVGRQGDQKGLLKNRHNNFSSTMLYSRTDKKNHDLILKQEKTSQQKKK